MASISAQNNCIRKATILAVTASMVASFLTGAKAQEATPIVAENATSPYPVTIHAGTCADYLARPAYILDSARPQIGATSGAPSAAPVVSTTSALDEPLDTLLADQAHVMLVHESPDAFGTPLVCGELGGVVADGSLVTALRPVGDSGLAGLAILTEDTGLLQLGDERVDVAMHLFTLADAEAPGIAAPQPVTATGEGFAYPEWLVDPAWVEQHIDQSEMRIIGLQDVDVTLQGSVPGASQMPIESVLPPDTSEEALQLWREDIAWQALNLQMGSEPDAWTEDVTIILYDSGTMDAAALWWALDYLGHQDKRIMEGGWQAWADHWGVPPDANMPAAPLGPVRTTTDEFATYQPQIHEERLSTLDDVAASLAMDTVVLVDSRPAEHFEAAHIPGAVNVPATDNLMSDAPRWRAPEELRERYAAAGIGPDATVIVYGDSGPGAAVTYLTLRLLGHDAVSLYPMGWDEWSRYPELPRAVAEATEDEP